MNEAIQSIRLYARATGQDAQVLVQKFKAAVKAQNPRDIPLALDLCLFEHLCERVGIDLQDVVDVDELIIDDDIDDAGDKNASGDEE